MSKNKKVYANKISKTSKKKRTSSFKTKAFSLQPATVFSFLERDFSSIIMEIRDGDSSGRPSTSQWSRKTIIFLNQTKLYVTEHLENENIDFYYYDWVTSCEKVILKWHSESHNLDKRYQTASEPFHIHLPQSETLHNMYRMANFEHQTLRSIIEFILLFDKIITSFGGSLPFPQKDS